jgi:outer membrane protein TolC
MKNKWISILITGVLVLGVISCGGSTLETDLAAAEAQVSTLEADLAAAKDRISTLVRNRPGIGRSPSLNSRSRSFSAGRNSDIRSRST